MSAAEDLIDAFDAAWSGRERAAFASCCAPDIHYEDPLTHGARHGPDALADHAALLWHAFPDARIERAGGCLTDGRFVAAPVRLVGTHRGDLARLPATKRAVALHAVLYCELDPEGTLLWRVRAFFDAYEAAAQLGVLPRPGTVGERALMLLRGFGLRS